MKTKAATIALAVLVIWLAISLVRVENERYALSVGMCRDQSTGMADPSCLATVESRTSWLWHLLYGMKVL